MILTPKELKPSKSQDRYLSRLLAEWYVGQPIDDPKSAFMQRGNELEGPAASAYMVRTDLVAVECGFCLTDDGIAGCSPDRLVGSDGLLEIKCPGAQEHLDYYLFGFGGDYMLQRQFQLYVTDREWVDLFSYNPIMPAAIERVARDPVVTAAIDKHLRSFTARLAEFKERLRTEKDAVFARLAVEDDSPI